MDEEPLLKLNASNLCTYYILPLLKLNTFRFGGDSLFLDCYLSTDSKWIYVKVVESFFVDQEVFTHPFYKKTLVIGDYEYITFRVPAEFASDVELFTLGKYSRMSEKAKNLIRTYSGLPYKARLVGTRTETDGRLLALTRAKVLREAWSSYLDVYSLSEEDELLDKPRPTWFVEELEAK